MLNTLAPTFAAAEYAGFKAVFRLNDADGDGAFDKKETSDAFDDLFNS